MGIFFLLLIATYLVAIFVAGAQYPAEARLLPFVIAGVLSILVIVQLVREFLARRTETGATVLSKKVVRPFLQPIFWMLGILPTIYLLGFIVGIPLYVFLYLKLHKESWRLSIIVTAIAAIVVYFGFGVLLNLRFHKGLLLPFL